MQCFRKTSIPNVNSGHIFHWIRLTSIWWWILQLNISNNSKTISLCCTMNIRIFSLLPKLFVQISPSNGTLALLSFTSLSVWTNKKMKASNSSCWRLSSKECFCIRGKAENWFNSYASGKLWKWRNCRCKIIVSADLW